VPEARGASARLGAAVVWAAALAVTLAAGWLLADVVLEGARGLSWSFLATDPSDAGRAGGIRSVLVATLWVLAIALAVALPLGVGTAVFLADRPTGGSVRLVRRSLDVLSGVPSIVFGLFGNAVFCRLLGLGFSVLAGGLTLAVIVLPTLIRLTEESLRAVPAELRQGAAALALSRTTTLLAVELPSAAFGIAAGLALGVGRALAETAALLFTSGYEGRLPTSPLDSGRVMSIHIFDLGMNVSGGDSNAYATALVLTALILAINALARGVAATWRRRLAGGV
jgi:phosphate transport system permease protein